MDGYTPELRYRDLHEVEKIKKLESMNQFVEMFNTFLLLLSSEDKAEQERKDIIKRARLMDKIENF